MCKPVHSISSLIYFEIQHLTDTDHFFEEGSLLPSANVVPIQGKLTMDSQSCFQEYCILTSFYVLCSQLVSSVTQLCFPGSTSFDKSSKHHSQINSAEAPHAYYKQS